MNPGLFHITLSMVRINGSKGVDEAKTLMDEIKEEFERIVKTQSCKLVLNGLDTFGQRVLFAKKKASEDMEWSEPNLTF